MQTTVTLDSLYTQYAAGLMKKKDFEAAVFRIIREDICQTRPYGWNRADYDDFVSDIYFRLGRAIDSYRDVGSSFETYIGALVRLMAKEYRSRKFRNDTAETAAWIVHFPEMVVCEEAPEYDDSVAVEEEEPSGLPDVLRSPRQLLILILKCCSYISDDFLEKLTPMLDIDQAELNRMIRILKERREKREADIKLMRERLNCQFFRCIFYEKRLQTVREGSCEERYLQVHLERGRKKLVRMRKQLARMRLDPSNCQIAEILGISKGAVDSVLYNVKARWNNEQNGNILD